MQFQITPRMRELLKRLWSRWKPEPEDPYAYVRQPLKRGPSGNSSAVALDEPR
jgi:hypothetical protein